MITLLTVFTKNDFDQFDIKLYRVDGKIHDKSISIIQLLLRYKMPRQRWLEAALENPASCCSYFSHFLSGCDPMLYLTPTNRRHGIYI